MLAADLSHASPSQEEIARRRPRLSAKVRAALKLQGRYMGYVRQLKLPQQAQVKKVRRAKGITAAILKAKGFARKATWQG